tara:strand:+ start:327 stop:470 length:144 start_codon:yes stop_codon:yes gene_type:complete
MVILQGFWNLVGLKKQAKNLQGQNKTLQDKIQPLVIGIQYVDFFRIN